MRLGTFVVAGVLLSAIMVCGTAEAANARAEFINAQGQSVGGATLVETPHGVKIALQLSGLPAGTHGFHIHAVGKCDPPAFTSAGGHFNPEQRKHGGMSAEGPHAGDLPSLVVEQHGSYSGEVTAHRVTLHPGRNSLFSANGTALVIHADPDDGKTDPTGNAGGRIACGVVTR